MKALSTVSDTFAKTQKHFINNVYSPIELKGKITSTLFVCLEVSLSLHESLTEIFLCFAVGLSFFYE